MRRLFEFAKTTVIGGFLVLLPVGVTALLVAKVVASLAGAVAPVAARISDHPFAAIALALGLLVGTCFLTGLIARTAFGARARRLLEERVLERLPGYTMLRSLSQRLVGEGDGTALAVALAVIEDALVPAFVIEEHDDGRFTIFVPAVPTPGVGALYILPRERVHLVDVPLAQAIQCITRWGAGSTALVRAMRPPTVASPPATR